MSYLSYSNLDQYKIEDEKENNPEKKDDQKTDSKQDNNKKESLIKVICKTIQEEPLIKLIWKTIKDVLLIFGVFLINYVVFFFFPFYQISVGFLKICIQTEKEKINFSLLFLFMSCFGSFIYCFISLIGFTSENAIVIYIQADGMVFYSQLMFVFTFLQMNYQKKNQLCTKMKNILNAYSISTFQYLNITYYDRYAYFLDFNILPELGGKVQSEDDQNKGTIPNSQNNEVDCLLNTNTETKNQNSVNIQNNNSSNQINNDQNKISEQNQNNNSSHQPSNQENQQEDKLENEANIKKNSSNQSNNDSNQQEIDQNNQKKSEDQSDKTVISQKKNDESIKEASNPPTAIPQRRKSSRTLNNEDEKDQDIVLKKKFNFYKFMSVEQYSQISLYFSYFQDKKSEINKPHHNVNHIFNEFLNYLVPRMKAFSLLLLIMAIKLGFCFYYIFLKSSDLLVKEYFDIFIIILLNIYNTFNLNRILGNNDLRRKSRFMKKLEKLIDFRKKKKEEIKLNQKLDITCPISIETWDNSRKFMLGYQEDWLQTLEWSYGCLLLCYLLVALVNLSSYFELHWIFSEDSVLQHPIMVIMSSLNFLFLSVFFLFRFYHGNRFNDSFEDLDNTLANLIDTMEDLETMFDVYFNNQGKDEVGSKIIKDTIYDLLIRKIKYKCCYYIKKELKFENQRYEDNEKDKSELRKKLLKNIKQSLKKVKKSLNQDAAKHKYKFFNLVELRFKETFFTLLIGFLTIFPTVIPRFKKFFESEPN